MSYTAPTKEPEWASANPVDPISGQPAILEPIAGKKASGHTRTERPPRQDHNWLFNLIWLWQQYLKNMVQAINVQLATFVNSLGSELTYDEQNYTNLTNALEFRYHKNFIEGFHILNWPSETEVAISNGKCTSDDRLYVIDGFFHSFPGPFTKKIDGTAYAFGSGNCGRADGVALVADTWYHLFVFRYNDISTPRIDLCFDTDVTGTNLPTNTGKRRIMSLHYAGGTDGVDGFYQVAQLGNHFIGTIQDANDIGPWGVVNQANIGPLDPPRLWVSLAGVLPPSVDVVAEINISKNVSGGTSKRTVMRSPVEVAAYAAFASAVFQGLEGEYRIDRFWKVIPGNDQRLWVGYHESDTNSGTLYLNFSVWSYIDMRGQDWGSGPSGDGPGRYIDHMPPT